VAEWTEYHFWPTAWYSSHSAWPYENHITGETEHQASLDIDMMVELVEPVKGLGRGKLQVVSEPNPERWGNGIFSYHTEEGHDERIFSGTVWTSNVGVLGLLMMLLAGREVGLKAQGQPFRYGQAGVQSFVWFVADHPNRDEM